MSPPRLITAIIALAVIATGCRRVLPLKDTLYDCDTFEVYTDSLVRGEKVFRAPSPTEITHAWQSDSVPAGTIRYSSQQLMADAMFNKSMQEVPLLTPMEIYLSQGALHPQESMDALREMVRKGRIECPGYPMTADNAAWGAAAWEVYCVTGDRKWLREAYDIITATLRYEHAATCSSVSSLRCGTPEYLTPPDDYYPEWMTAIDRYQTISTGVNALHAYTLEIASEMAKILRLKAEMEHKIASTASRNAINDRLWIPNLGYYGEYLYGNYYPILTHTTDNAANALCVLLDIATPEMAQSIVSRSPILPDGVPLTYPAIHSGALPDPTIQALWGLSAAKARNVDAMRAATGMLWNIALDHRAPSQWQAMVMKAFFGMKFTPEGIQLSPIVPTPFDGRKTLSHFRYRDAELTISLQGTGDKVAGFMIDSISSSTHIIPADLTGKHTVEITLSGNVIPYAEVTTAHETTLPRVPEIKWSTPTQARITNFVEGYSYGIYLNGTFLEEIQTRNYTYTPSEPTVVDIVPIAAEEYIGFSPRSHLIAPGASLITIPASTITPRRTPLHLIPHRETATHYIELAARHNTRLTFYANVPEPGEYFINIGYSNGTTYTGMRTLTVNGDYCGVLVCPSGNHNDWVTVHPSNTLTVKLNAGPNQFALTYIDTTLLLNKITLLKKTDSTQQ